MKLLALSAALAVSATAAFAGAPVAPIAEATPVAPAPVAMPATDWTGGYAGVSIGSGNAEADYMGLSADEDFDSYGVFGGYNYDAGLWVFGGEADYSNIDLDNTSEDGDLYRLRGRVGYDLGPVLPFVTLGVAHVKAEDLSETGITYGLGLDYMLTDQFVIGAEYSMNHFSDVENVNGLDVDADLFQIRAAYKF